MVLNQIARGDIVEARMSVGYVGNTMQCLTTRIAILRSLRVFINFIYCIIGSENYCV